MKQKSKQCFLALHWLRSVPDPALKNAAHSVLAKLNAVLPKNKQELIDETMLRSINHWLVVDEKIVEQVRLAIRYQVKIEVHYLDEKQNIFYPYALAFCFRIFQ